MCYPSYERDDIYDTFEEKLDLLLASVISTTGCTDLFKILDDELNDPEVNYSCQLFNFVAMEILGKNHPCQTKTLEWLIDIVSQNADSDIADLICVVVFAPVIGDCPNSDCPLDTKIRDAFLSLCQTENTIELVLETYAMEEKFDDLPNDFKAYTGRNQKQGLPLVPFPEKAYNEFKQWIETE